MSNESARDELARDIFIADNNRALHIDLLADWEALCKAASSTPTGNTYAHNIADGLLAAGYRKPRTITTAAELDALPFLSVITDAYETPYVCERHRIDGTGNEWQAAGTSYLQESQYVLEHGDVTVHFTPDPA